MRKPSANGSRTANDSTSVCCGDASVRPGVKGTVTAWPPFFAACSIPAPPASTIRSAIDTFFCPLLNEAWMPSSVFSTLAGCAGLLTGQSFCGANRMRAPFAPPRLSEPRKVDADAHAVDTSSATVSPAARMLFLSAAMSFASIN